MILMLMWLASLVEPVRGNTSGHTQLQSSKNHKVFQILIQQTPAHALVVEILLLISWVHADYYCESALNSTSGNLPWFPSRFYPNDPLWDGQDWRRSEQTCCDPPNLPWFCKELPQSTTDYLELRICGDQPLADEGTPVDLVQLYIQ